MDNPQNIRDIKPKPNQQVIDHLEALLADARSGEIQSVASVCWYIGNDTSRGWAGMEGVSAETIVGETFILANELARIVIISQEESNG